MCVCVVVTIVAVVGSLWTVSCLGQMTVSLHTPALKGGREREREGGSEGGKEREREGGHGREGQREGGALTKGCL